MRSSVVLTAFQVFSRVFLTWAITYSVPSVSPVSFIIDVLYFFYINVQYSVLELSVTGDLVIQNISTFLIVTRYYKQNVNLISTKIGIIHVSAWLLF